MKKLIYGTLILALVGVGFNSCEKEDLSDSIINNEVNIVNKNDIPTFENREQLIDKINMLSNISEDDRREYEKSNNYKSLLTSSLEVYEGLDLESVSSIEEIEEYALENSAIVCLRENYEREMEYYAYYSDNYYSAIANPERLFIVGDICYKVFDDGIATTHKSNLELLKASDEIYAKNLIENDKIHISLVEFDQSNDRTACHSTDNIDTETNNKNRTKLHVYTGKETVYNQQLETYVYLPYVYGIVRPYKKTLGIWYFAKRTLAGRLKYSASYTAGGSSHALSGQRLFSNYHAYKYSYRIDGYSIGAWASTPTFNYIDSYGDTPDTSPAIINCN